MRWFVMALLLCACGRMEDEGVAVVPAPDTETVDAVMEDLLSRLEEAHSTDGPRFTLRLPELKDEAARNAGYQDWEQFKEGLHSTDPSREIALSRLITRRMEELLNQPAKPAGGGGE